MHWASDSCHFRSGFLRNHSITSGQRPTTVRRDSPRRKRDEREDKTLSEDKEISLTTVSLFARFRKNRVSTNNERNNLEIRFNDRSMLFLILRY